MDVVTVPKTRNGLSVAQEGETRNGLSVAQEGQGISTLLETVGIKRTRRRIRTYVQREPRRRVVKESVLETRHLIDSLRAKTAKLKVRQQSIQAVEPGPLVGPVLNERCLVMGNTTVEQFPMHVEISSSDTHERHYCKHNCFIKGGHDPVTHEQLCACCVDDGQQSPDIKEACKLPVCESAMKDIQSDEPSLSMSGII